MNNTDLKSDNIQIIMDNEEYITQSEAASILAVTRQRVGQYVKHPEHSISLGVVNIEGKIKLTRSKVLTFQRRSEYRGKRGKQKKIKTTLDAVTL